jgi:hypothetical protein
MEREEEREMWKREERNPLSLFAATTFILAKL